MECKNHDLDSATIGSVPALLAPDVAEECVVAEDGRNNPAQSSRRCGVGCACCPAIVSIVPSSQKGGEKTAASVAPAGTSSSEQKSASGSACEPVLSKRRYDVPKSVAPTTVHHCDVKGVVWVTMKRGVGTLDSGRWKCASPSFGPSPCKKWRFFNPKTLFPSLLWLDAVECAKNLAIQCRRFHELICFLGRSMEGGRPVRAEVLDILRAQKKPLGVHENCSECQVKEYLKQIFFAGKQEGQKNAPTKSVPIVSEEEFHSVAERILEAKRLGAEEVYAVLRSEATAERVERANRAKRNGRVKGADDTQDVVPECGKKKKIVASVKKPVVAVKKLVQKPVAAVKKPVKKPNKKSRFLRVKGFGNARAGVFEISKISPKSMKSVHFDLLYKRRWDAAKANRLYDYGDVFFARYCGGGDRRLWGWYILGTDDWGNRSKRIYGFARDTAERGETVRPPKKADWFVATGERGKQAAPVRKFPGKITVKRREKPPRWKMY